MEKSYNVSKKRGEKWWSYGRIAINKFGNLQLSMKITPELQELVNGEGYLNFSLFEDDGGNYKTKSKPVEKPQAIELNDEIPF